MNKEELNENISLLELKIRNENLSASEKEQSFNQLLAFYDSLIKIDIEDYFAYMGKTNAYIYLLNDYQNAVLTLETAIDILGYNKVMYLRLCESYQKFGKYSDALKILDEVLRKEIVNDYLYDRRAELNRQLGNFAEAESDQKRYNAYQAAEKAKWDDPNHYYHYK